MDILAHGDRDGLAAAMGERGIEVPPDDSWAQLVDFLLTKFVEPELDARQRAGVPMVPHAADPKAQRMQHGFGPFDHAQLLIRDLAEVRDAGGQAGRCRLVPGRQPGLPGELADLGFRQPGLVERTPDAE
ncbi:MAG: hypothetical protein KY463_04170, partial [Actinobacteria bacterium]|nr:hypothetical protein [Actinomycetota bacterium]